MLDTVSQPPFETQGHDDAVFWHSHQQNMPMIFTLIAHTMCSICQLVYVCICLICLTTYGVKRQLLE